MYADSLVPALRRACARLERRSRRRRHAATEARNERARNNLCKDWLLDRAALAAVRAELAPRRPSRRGGRARHANRPGPTTQRETAK